MSEMQAGREMDCLIAEVVFGWGKDTPENVSRNHGYYNCKKLLRYSTDIAAVWEVVEKMPSPFGIMKGYKETYGVGKLGWVVNWCREQYCDGWDCEHGNEAWAETAPLAICRAALKALGVS